MPYCSLDDEGCCHAEFNPSLVTGAASHKLDVTMSKVTVFKTFMSSEIGSVCSISIETVYSLTGLRLYLRSLSVKASYTKVLTP